MDTTLFPLTLGILASLTSDSGNRAAPPAVFLDVPPGHEEKPFFFEGVLSLSGQFGGNDDDDSRVQIDACCAPQRSTPPATPLPTTPNSPVMSLTANPTLNQSSSATPPTTGDGDGATLTPNTETLSLTTTTTAATSTTTSSATALGTTNATTTAQVSSTPTTSLSSTTNIVASTPTSTDNTPLIVGVVVGSLLFLAVVAVIVFFFRRRKSKAELATMPARSGDNDMVSGHNEYGQLPGSESPYAATAAAFKAGIPQGSNYTNIPKESPYAVSAADFKAGVSQASNYSDMPES
jgi:hypothetical protein